MSFSPHFLAFISFINHLCLNSLHRGLNESSLASPGGLCNLLAIYQLFSYYLGISSLTSRSPNYCYLSIVYQMIDSSLSLQTSLLLFLYVIPFFEITLQLMLTLRSYRAPDVSDLGYEQSVGMPRGMVLQQV